MAEKSLVDAKWAPTMVINGVIIYNPYRWPCTWVTGGITSISGVLSLLITGRGPFCLDLIVLFRPAEYHRNQKNT